MNDKDDLPSTLRPRVNQQFQNRLLCLQQQSIEERNNLTCQREDIGKVSRKSHKLEKVCDMLDDQRHTTGYPLHAHESSTGNLDYSRPNLMTKLCMSLPMSVYASMHCNILYTCVHRTKMESSEYMFVLNTQTMKSPSS